MSSVAAGPTLGPSIAELLHDHRCGVRSPVQTAHEVLTAITAAGDDGTWLWTVPPEELIAAAGRLQETPGAADLPLYGVPFGVKDSIDVAGVPTTLSCPGYAYTAEHTAPAVARLLAAGALFVGKTNLDQFATGLNGTRTPYIIPRSVFGGDMICGGSSSGSARAVALGQVPFAVATDTAGSGRVPAALNGVIGYKPSRGLISTTGLVPACRSLDCITLMAGCIDDVDRVMAVIAGHDDPDPDNPAPGSPDPWARVAGPRYAGAPVTVGLPPFDELEFFGDSTLSEAHRRFRDNLITGGVGGLEVNVVDVSLEPFLEAGALLYSGPWVAERLTEFGDFLAEQPDSIHPVVRDILRSGLRYTAVDAFAALQKLQELRAVVGRAMYGVDALLVPTIGRTFTVDEVLAEPISANTTLGHYTHFGNLLDLLGVAVPAGLTSDGRPHSVTVLAPALADDTALHLAAHLLGTAR